MRCGSICNPPGDYVAYFKNKPFIWGYGKNSNEAIGCLIRISGYFHLEDR